MREPSAEELAQRHLDTTAIDVVNALVAGTLEAAEVPDDLFAAIEAENVAPDDDPDASLGWRMGSDGPEAE